jgi:SAM-dependent methyltransferase
MLVNGLMPERLRPVLVRIYPLFNKTRIGPWAYGRVERLLTSRVDVHQYWRRPSDSSNLPQAYLEGASRSQLLIDVIERYAKPNTRILEIGCNVGRNLDYLFKAGFVNLSGIEINEEAVRLLKQSFPEMAGQTTIYNAPLEESIVRFGDGEFDIVFTMAVLEHIHRDSSWVFPEIVRITNGYLITIEDERARSWRCFPRNYQRVFEPLGMTQVEEVRCDEVDGLGSNFYARAFSKR